MKLAKHYSKYFHTILSNFMHSMMESSEHHHEVGAIIVYIIQMSKLKHRLNNFLKVTGLLNVRARRQTQAVESKSRTHVHNGCAIATRNKIL